MNIELLKSMCAANGISGDEGAIKSLILGEIENYIDDHSVDALGSLIAHKKGPGKKMMLAGHMDQIGLIVTYISKEGFIYFGRIGGMRPAYSLGQRFVFPNGTVGVVACERLDDPRDMPFEKMYLDIGARDGEEAGRQIKIGDVCVYSAAPVVNGGAIISPALDDRVGCFIMVEALKKIKAPAFDLYFVFTSQEEVGLRGARTSAYAVEPDYGLAFDVTISADTPKAHKFPSKMHGGAAIKIKDSSVLCHPIIVKHLEDCAKKAGIRYQYEILEAGGTDSGAIHLTKGGVPSGVISVATRYVHSANEMCALSDIEDSIELTVNALETPIA
ncbi:MAG: M20/M25/M40 family metallo-hydrolase [Oscillospiraceae bacterium]|nr:M20/M25/M40 family metallo-hydrolase [Oscillospiraceae bacterium]